MPCCGKRLLRRTELRQACLYPLPLRDSVQPLELLLIVVIDRFPDRTDGVDVVAVSLHPHLVEPAASLHGDEIPLCEDFYRLRRRVQRQPRSSSDGAAAGMALVSAAVLAVEEVCVDQKGGVRQGQQENLIGQREKTPGFTLE